MLKLINALLGKYRTIDTAQQAAVFDKQLLADLGLSWKDVCQAKAALSSDDREGAVFP